MTTKIGTYATVADFEAVSTRIIRGIGNAKRLMQEATIAAMEHLNAHGNVNVFAPLDKAGAAFTKAQHKLWRAYIQHYTWMRYNVDNKTGKALASAAFDKLWTKDKSGKIDIDGAKDTDWYTFEAPGTDKPDLDLDDYVKSVEKRIKSLLKDQKLLIKTGATGGAITIKHAKAVDVRKALIAMLTVLTDVHHEPVVEDGKPKADEPKATSETPVSKAKGQRKPAESIAA